MAIRNIACRLLFASSFVLSPFIGCSFSSEYSLHRQLSNQGIVAVSNDNPYVVSNVLLTREAEKSQTLRGFLEFRGNPTALAVRKEFLEDYKIDLYYLDKQETYTISDAGVESIILGPQIITEPLLSSLKRTFPAPLSPVTLSKIESTRKEVTTFVKNADLPRAKGYDDRAILHEVKNDMVAPQKEKFDFASQVMQSTQTPPIKRTETSSSGDLTHKVTFPGETLRLISFWYTGDPTNAERLSRINALEDPNLLSLGQEILIPRYLLTNLKPLPETEVNMWRANH